MKSVLTPILSVGSLLDVQSKIYVLKQNKWRRSDVDDSIDSVLQAFLVYSSDVSLDFVNVCFHVC